MQKQHFISTPFLSSLPLMPLPAEMRVWDQQSVALGIPDPVLMENAARAALSVLLKELGSVAGRDTALFMGPGNNGGDAACLARLLMDYGAKPVVFHTKALSAAQGSTAVHVKAAQACGVPFRHVSDFESGKFTVLVDGLLGTGFHGALSESMLDLVCAINDEPGAFTLALDIPSGLDAVTGRPCPEAVRADATATFAAPKPGLVLPEAGPWVGRLTVCEIGTPLCVKKSSPCSFRCLGMEQADALPGPEKNAHKNTYGHVVVTGGAGGLSGAAQTAALAALRAGAGLVTAAAPASAVRDIKGTHAEIMVLGLGNGGEWPSSAESMDDLIRRAGALAVGPGMGTGPDALAFLKSLLAMPGRPAAVVDADALTLIAAHPGVLGLLTERDVITPHPGEAGRLLGLSPRGVQEDRFAAIRSLTGLSPAAVVLKGAGTLLAQMDSPIIVAPFDEPALACAGSGDVLAGMTAALLCRTGSALEAAAFGVIWHVAAGAETGKAFPGRGNLAGDIVNAIPLVMKNLMEKRGRNGGSR